MIEKLFTIGAFGKTEPEFFRQVENADVDTFCDIRQRRGVRGSQYAFVNSKRLQAGLAARKITYLYVPELAPTQQIREAQHVADRAMGVGKRDRKELGDLFKQKYTEDVLVRYDSAALLRVLGPAAHRVVLFCVEGTPMACHRSLAANKLHVDWDVPLEHL